MEKIKWHYSNEERQWAEKTYRESPGADADLALDGRQYQKMFGFGGCLNELGYRTLCTLPENTRNKLLQELFEPGGNRCSLNFCRIPVGANDYSENWYSLDEISGDYALKNFSIERDRKGLIPYIRHVKEYAPELKLFASPWSPPTWMKSPPVYNGGKLIFTKEIMTSYADYLVKFLAAYQKEEIEIAQLHVQNEPVASQKFPSCLWSGEELRDFIRDYLGPALRASGLKTELWLGTINAPGCDFNRLIFDKWATEDYDYFANAVLSDPDALQYLSGVSYQWGGKIAIQRTFESWWPRLRLMQSENECGFGDNTWEYARYIWTMFKHYINNGAESYLYWNLILEPQGLSTWGDSQNAMVTVEPVTKEVIYNPDFYVMKHFSSAIRRGAIRLGTQGTLSADSLAFRNPDGSYILELFNPFRKPFAVRFLLDGKQYAFSLEPLSFNTISLSNI